MQTSTIRSQILPIVLIASVLAFPRSFLELKLVLLGLVAIHFAFRIRNRVIYIPRPIMIFYSTMVALGLIWSIIGYLRGNPIQAIEESIRLYVAWSVLIVILLLYLRQFDANLIIHRSVLLAGTITSVINISFIASAYQGTPLYPVWMQEAMLLRVGFHDGYVQLVSHNVATLLFIIPYLVVTLLRRDGRSEHTILTGVVLVATLLAAILSGRRAVWLVISLTPFLIWGLSILTHTGGRIRHPLVFKSLSVLGMAVAIFAPFVFLREDTLDFLLHAFSSDDQRSIQVQYLTQGFRDHFVFGSGFGGYAGYLRNENRPWLYELTYFQILFNFGIIGSSLFALVVGFVFIKALRLIQHYHGRIHSGSIAILTGVLAILIGSYSNPYLGSFDYLVIVGFLPMIASLTVPAGQSHRLSPVGLNTLAMRGRAGSQT